MRLPSGEIAGYASDCSPAESCTRFCATCGPVARRPIRVTSPPTEQRASANSTAGRRKNFPDAIRFLKKLKTASDPEGTPVAALILSQDAAQLTRPCQMDHYVLHTKTKVRDIL